MKICRFFIAPVILLLSLQTLQGQKIKISGTGEGYRGAELRFYFQSDPVTKSLIPVFRTPCDTSGFFSCEISVKPSELVVIRTGIYKLSVYIDKVSDLVLKLPCYISKTYEEEQNTFFAETETIPEVINEPGNINNLMRTFDLEYNPLFNRIAGRVMYNFKRNEIPSLIEKLNHLVSPGMPEYFNDFVKYRLVMLNLVASGDYPERIEDSVLINSRFSPSNQAYTELIEQMFTKYFSQLSAGKLKDSFKHAVAVSSAEEMKKVLYLDGKAANEELREYVIILNLFNEYYYSAIPGGKIEQMLNEINQKGSSEYIRDLAGKILHKLTALSTGTRPPGIRLSDESGKLVSIDDLNGSYVLLSFARSDNSFSVSEYGIMNTWLSRYSKKMKVVTVLRDRDFEAGVKRLHNMGFNWLFLDGSGADSTEYHFDVTMYPSFMLIDRAGKISARPCPFPSENLDMFLGKKFAEENN